MKRDQDKLDRVACSIVDRLGSVGVFHLNKLTFLFEYFYIKNFGVRYTREVFTKLPHGPVIANYKTHIKSLHTSAFINIDINLLMKKRDLDDDFEYVSLNITPNESIKSCLLEDSHASSLLDQILHKYSWLPGPKLEKTVYKTPPVMEYLRRVEMGYKKETGSYILTDCLKMNTVKANVDPGMKLYLEHIKNILIINLKK